MAEEKLTVALFGFEAMLAQKFHIYAGGLGTVLGGFLKSAGRTNWPVNLHGLSILWKQGYYDQKMGPEGMTIDYTTRHYDFLEDTGVKVKVRVNGRENMVKVWYLKPEVFKTAPLYLLDTDLEENDELARSITGRLYGGNEETRLAQEIVLGIGGVRALQALGISVDIYHGHEGHSVLAAIEILRQYMAAGLSFDKAWAATKKRFVFTTHTPELAGNEEHSLDLMLRMGCLPGLSREEAHQIGGHHSNHQMFNMTIGGFRLAKKANAVSQLHLETVRQMWCGVDGLCPLISITNGVDLDWQLPEFVHATSAEAIQQAKEKYKEKLIRENEKRTGKKFRGDVLTIVLARRFTDYKRPWLIFMDWPWLEKLLWQDKLQIIIAGKPHPNDLHAINIFNEIYKKSLKVPNLAVWAGYEYGQNKKLKAGADLWLQTSRRLREACGTSWISASFNGALVMSSRDGGILESAPENRFLFGVDRPIKEGEQDTIDFQDLQRVLDEALEMYYHDKLQWYKQALVAKIEAENIFTSDRMLQNYIKLLYKVS